LKDIEKILMEESNISEDQYVSFLIEKQVKKFITENNSKDPYFSIRQDFDIDQWVWDFVVYIYKASGYSIDCLKTKQLILEHRSSAWLLYEKEQEEKQEKITQQTIEIEKKRIQLEINNLEIQQEYESNSEFTEKSILKEMINLRQQELDIIYQEKKYILQQIEKAERDYNLMQAAELRYGTLSEIERKIEEIEAILVEIKMKGETMRN
jgi:hypothetical protein